MTFLVLKIFAYLGVALFSGAAVGWLLRSRLPSDVPVDASELIELQNHIERLESALVSRDDELADAQGNNDALQAALNTRTHRVAQLEEQLRELKVELSSAAPANEEADGLITALHNEVSRLREELLRLETEPGRAAVDVERTVKELEARLVRKASELDRLEQALSGEERKVRELERERDLQNKSLHVLHQQLELERERPRSAHG